MRNFRGTCSCVEMLKGYMFRERLGALGLEQKTVVDQRFIFLRHLQLLSKSDVFNLLLKLTELIYEDFQFDDIFPSQFTLPPHTQCAWVKTPRSRSKINKQQFTRKGISIFDTREWEKTGFSGLSWSHTTKS